MFWALMRSITTIDTPDRVTNLLETCGHPSKNEVNGLPTMITLFTSPVRQLKMLQKGLSHDLEAS